MSLSTVKVQLGLPYRNIWLDWSSLWNKICPLIFLILFKRVCLGVWKLGQWSKTCVVVSVSFPQSHNGFRVSCKQYLNLWLQRWLRPSHNLVRSLIPYGLWILKVLFAQDCIKNFMAPFYGWGSTTSRLVPLRGGSLLFITKFPDIPGTNVIKLRRMKGWVNLGATQWFWTQDPWIIKFSWFFLKIETLPEFLILQLRLFHSDVVKRKNEFLK